MMRAVPFAELMLVAGTVLGVYVLGCFVADPAAFCAATMDSLRRIAGLS